MPKPATLENAVMDVLWSSSAPLTVRQVLEQVTVSRPLAYTTVQTMMNLLEGKGHLAKSPGPKAQLYAPTKPQAQVESGILFTAGDIALDAGEHVGPDRAGLRVAHVPRSPCGSRRLPR